MNRLLNLELTSYCNADCSMCPRDKVKDFGYISMETIEALFQKIKDYSLYEISLSGRGEPTFHPQLIEILEKLKTLAHKMSANLSLVTTTDGLNDKNYKDCVDNLDIVRLSVSSIDKNGFYKIHRGLDYDKIWRNIQKIVDYRPEKINIHLVGGQDTYSTLEQTIKYFKDHNINNIHLFPLWNRGGNVEEQEITELRKYLVEKYNIFYSEDEYLPEEKVKMLYNPNYCPIGDTSISVNYKGEMIGCFQDFENITKICDVTDKTQFTKERIKVLKKMPVCMNCNSFLMARK